MTTAHHHRRPRRVLVKVGRVRVTTVHCKAVCAYGGAFMVAADFGSAVAGPLLFPHLYHALEPLFEVGFAKGGAVLGGAAVFFDKIADW